jgi:hypothetical protein
VLPFHYLSADVVQTATFDARAEVRGRVVENDIAGDKTGSGAFVDTELAPKATYKIEWSKGRASFLLGYAPRLVWQNTLAPSGTLDTVHRPNAALVWKVSPRTNFVATSLVQYANVTLPTLLVQPRWDGGDRPLSPFAFPPPAATLRVFSSTTSVSLFHLASNRLQLQPSVYLTTFGALDTEGRKNIPYLQNPGLRLEGTYALSPKDELLFDLQPQLNIFTQVVPEQNRAGKVLATDGLPIDARRPNPLAPNDVTKDRPAPDAKFAQLTGDPIYQVYTTLRYRHRFSPHTWMEAEVGQSTTAQDWSKNEADPYNQRGGATQLDLQVFPIAELYANTSFGTSSSVRGKLVAYSRLGPSINSVTGSIQRRVDSVLALSLGTKRNTVVAQLGFLVTLPGEEFLFRQLAGELSYARKLNRDWSFDVGGRLGLQTAELRAFVPGAPARVFSALQPGGYVGLTFQPRPAKF